MGYVLPSVELCAEWEGGRVPVDGLVANSQFKVDVFEELSCCVSANATEKKSKNKIKKKKTGTSRIVRMRVDECAVLVCQRSSE